MRPNEKEISRGSTLKISGHMDPKLTTKRFVGSSDWLGLVTWLKLQWFCADPRYDLLVRDPSGRFMLHLFV